MLCLSLAPTQIPSYVQRLQTCKNSQLSIYIKETINQLTLNPAMCLYPVLHLSFSLFLFSNLDVKWRQFSPLSLHFINTTELYPRQLEADLHSSSASSLYIPTKTDPLRLCSAFTTLQIFRTLYLLVAFYHMK